MICCLGGCHSGPSYEPWKIQAIVSAQDFETFALIAYETLWLENRPLRYKVEFPTCLYHTSSIARMELLEPLNLTRYSRRPSAKASFSQQHADQCTHHYISPANSKFYFEILKRRADDWTAEGNHHSAAFYFRKSAEDRINGRDLHNSMVVENLSLHTRNVVLTRYWQAEALAKACQPTEAFDAINAAIDTMDKAVETVVVQEPVITNIELSVILTLKARLDEGHGSLSKLQEAFQGLKLAFSNNRGNLFLEHDIQRVGRRIRTLEISESW